MLVGFVKMQKLQRALNFLSFAEIEDKDFWDETNKIFNQLHSNVSFCGIWMFVLRLTLLVLLRCRRPLKYATVPILRNSLCNSWPHLNGQMSDNELCAGECWWHRVLVTLSFLQLPIDGIEITGRQISFIAASHHLWLLYTTTLKRFVIYMVIPRDWNRTELRTRSVNFSLLVFQNCVQ